MDVPSKLTRPPARCTIADLDKKPARLGAEFKAVEAQLAGLARWRAVAPSDMPQAVEAVRELVKLCDTLRNAVLPLLNSALEALAGQRLQTVKENKTLVRDINSLRAAFSLVLKLTSDKTEDRVPVYLRCNTVPRSRSGSFQASQADATRRTLHSKTTFPTLKAEIAGDDPSEAKQ